MSFEVVRRATLLAPSNPQGDLSKKHLFVVMCNPNRHGDVLRVSVSTYRQEDDHDATCLLEKGDHPFIKHTSFVQYRWPLQDSAATIKQRVAQKFYIARGLIDGKIFQRILDGFYVSPSVPNFVFDFLPTHR